MLRIYLFLILLFCVGVLAQNLLNENADIVIMGAGIAGIKSLRDLTDAGRTSVVVLEANNRYGGRINTVYVPGFDEPEEKGGSFLADSNYNPMIALAYQANITIYPMDFGKTKAWKNGRPLNINQGDTIYNKYLAVWAAAVPFFKTGRSKADAIRMGGYNFDDSGVETLFMTDEQVFGANLEQIDSNATDKAPEPLGSDYIIPGGYKQLLDYILDYPTSVRNKLRLNSTVSKIDYSSPNNKVVVSYTQNGVQKQITANKIIITVSMGVLKAGTITFVPALPADKQNAINKVNFGNCGKGYMFFNASVGPLLAQYPVNIFYRLGLMPNPRGNDALTYFYNNQYIQGQPVIQSFHCGNFTRLMDSLSDAQVVAIHMMRLREFLPDLPDPVSTIITRWGTDPLFRGVYTDFAVGNTVDLFSGMGLPVQNKLYFAGEYVALLDANGNLRASLGNVYTSYLSAETSIKQILGGN